MLTLLVTIFWSVPIVIAGLIKLIIWRNVAGFADAMMWCWYQNLVLLLKFNRRLTWDIDGLVTLDKQSWYLLISNHRSWADIVVLYILFRDCIPMNKYFLKQQLAWVPFIGLACWALDMPFMRRYSHQHLLRHPAHRGKDIYPSYFKLYRC